MHERGSIDNKLGLVFATISRPHAVQRLILSVRKYYPSIPIYVADQSTPTVGQEEFYLQNNCQIVWMDHDAGVCASRNAAVALVKEPYFVLCDDDFIITSETDFTPAVSLLEADLTIGVVGGRLLDILFDEFSRVPDSYQRFWELLFFHDPSAGKLLTVPVHYFAPDPKKIDDIQHYQCDAVMNFAVFRTAIFDEKIRWDPIFKSNGEHEDFYLNLKTNGRHRVVYMPGLLARHHHPPLQSYSRLRERSRGWQIFLEKWSLKQFLELDGGLRIINSVDKVQSYAMGAMSNFILAPLWSPPNFALLQMDLQFQT